MPPEHCTDSDVHPCKNVYRKTREYSAADHEVSVSVSSSRQYDTPDEKSTEWGVGGRFMMTTTQYPVRLARLRRLPNEWDEAFTLFQVKCLPWQRNIAASMNTTQISPKSSLFAAQTSLNCFAYIFVPREATAHVQEGQ